MAENSGWGRGGRSPHYFRMRGRSTEAVPSLQSFVFPPPPIFSDSTPLNAQIHPFFNQLIFYVPPLYFVVRPLQKWGDKKKVGEDIPKKNFARFARKTCCPPTFKMRFAWMG